MRSVPYIALAALFMLAACGGGGSGGKPASMTQQPNMSAVDTDGDNADAFPNDAAETMATKHTISTWLGRTETDSNAITAKILPAGYLVVRGSSSIDLESGNEIISRVESSSLASREHTRDFLKHYSWEGRCDTSSPIRRFDIPPIVRFIPRQDTPRVRHAVMRSIDALNAYLPYNQHITIGEDITEEELSRLTDNGIFNDELANIITVDLKSDEADATRIMLANGLYGHVNVGGGIFDSFLTGKVDTSAYSEEDIRRGVRAEIQTLSTVGTHELYHVMFAYSSINDHLSNYTFEGPGIHVPVSDFPTSHMAYGSPGAVHYASLTSIDGEALNVVYTRFPSTIWPDDLRAESFGPWDDYAIRYSGTFLPSIRTRVPEDYSHLAMETDDGDWDEETSELVLLATIEAGFGVDWRNGMARPWTNGEATLNRFADSGLSGSATWNGELVGFTPAREAVQGDSAINVDLATMAGNAAFTALEHWNAGAPPGGRGTGAQWHDGDLHYTLALDGNYFRSNGGDEGYVSGRFVGEEHQGTVGILERPDLTGAFGAVRQ